MKLQEVTLYENRSHRVLKEGWHDLTEWQKNYVNDFERQLTPLLNEMAKLYEAELTAQQIDAIFKNAETVAMSGGNNRTALGKGGDAVAKGAKATADTAKLIKQKYDEIKKAALNSGPVGEFDQKFEDLKKQVREKMGGDDAKAVQMIDKMGQWAKDNPGKASIVIAVLTALAGMTLVSTAYIPVVVGVLNMSMKLLKGERLSKAIVAGLEAGVITWAAGKALEAMGGMISKIANMKVEPLSYSNQDYYRINVGNGMPDVFADYELVTADLEQAQLFKDAWAKAAQLWDRGSYDLARDSFAAIEQIAQDATAETLANASSEQLRMFYGGGGSDVAEAIKSSMQSLQALAAAGANGAIAFNDKGTPVDENGNEVAVEPGDLVKSKAGNIKAAGTDRKATAIDPGDKQGRDDIRKAAAEESVDMEAELDRYIAEIDGGAIDAAVDSKAGQAVGGALKKGFGALKKGASAAGGAISKGAKAAGKELGNKVTYNKMMSAWKKAGEPTDTGSIINILQGLGMSPEQIQSVGDEQGVNLKAKNIGDPEEPAAEPAAKTAQGDTGKPADDSAAQGGDAAPADDSAPAAEPGSVVKSASGQDVIAGVDGKPTNVKPNDKKGIAAIKKAAAAQGGGAAKGSAAPKTKTVAKGDVVKGKDGKQYRWEGALYTDLDTGRTIGVQATVDMGLPHPKIDPVRDAVKAAGPDVMAMVLDQISSKGVKAGTKDAQVAAKAGAKGTQALPSAQAKQAKAGIAKPGTVAPKPKKAAAV